MKEDSNAVKLMEIGMSTWRVDAGHAQVRR